MTQPPAQWSPEGESPWGQPSPPAPPMAPPPQVQPTWEQPAWGQQPVAPPVMAPPPQAPPAWEQPAWGQQPVAPSPMAPPQWAPQQSAPPPWGQPQAVQMPAQQPVEEPVWMQAHPGRIGSTIPGYEWTATPSPRSSMAVGELRPTVETKWLWGVGAAVGVALAFAVLHASLAVATEWLLGWYVTFVLGLAIGATLKKVGRVSGAGPGLVGALIAVVGWTLTVFFALAGLTAKVFGVAFFPLLQSLMSEWVEVLRMYFDEAPMQYLAVLAAAAGGFIGANAGFKWPGRR